MCVKEFLGFNCGHCAIPYLRACPLTSSQPGHPPCSFPAERPIFTNDYCPPCARVVWNIEVLRIEAAHREKHENSECGCEVIFSEEERTRRFGAIVVATPRVHQRVRPKVNKQKSGSDRRHERRERREDNKQVVPYVASDVAVDGGGAVDGDDNVGAGFGGAGTARPDVSIHRGDENYIVSSTYTPPEQMYANYTRPEPAFTGYTNGPLTAEEWSYARGTDMDDLAVGYGIPHDGYVPHESAPARNQTTMKWYSGVEHGNWATEPEEFGNITVAYRNEKQFGSNAEGHVEGKLETDTEVDNGDQHLEEMEESDTETLKGIQVPDVPDEPAQPMVVSSSGSMSTLV